MDRTNSAESVRQPAADKPIPDLNNFSDLMKHLYKRSNEVEKKLQKSIDKEIKLLTKKLNAVAKTEEIVVADGAEQVAPSTNSNEKIAAIEGELKTFDLNMKQSNVCVKFIEQQSEQTQTELD
jgi:hypothetical protein